MQWWKGYWYLAVVAFIHMILDWDKSPSAIDSIMLFFIAVIGWGSVLSLILFFLGKLNKKGS